MKKVQNFRISLTFIVVLSTHLHLKAVLVNSHLIHTSLMSLVTNLKFYQSVRTLCPLGATIAVERIPSGQQQPGEWQ